MPNGGSDCCGTCMFFSEYDKKKQTSEISQDSICKCCIREIEIDVPFYTYCANHQDHNQKKYRIPIGPVYECKGYPYVRNVLKEAPNDEKTRSLIINVLNNININSRIERGFIFSETDFDLEVIKHVTQLRDNRALGKLKEITNWPEEYYAFKTKKEDFQIAYMKRLNCVLVALSIEGTLAIGGSNCIKDVLKYQYFGINSENIDQELAAVLRYHFVRGLRECISAESLGILEKMKNDSDNYVRGFAYDAIRKITQEIWEPSFSINKMGFMPPFIDLHLDVNYNERRMNEEIKPKQQEILKNNDDSDIEELNPIE